MFFNEILSFCSPFSPTVFYACLPLDFTHLTDFSIRLGVTVPSSAVGAPAVGDHAGWRLQTPEGDDVAKQLRQSQPEQSHPTGEGNPGSGTGR